MSSTNEHECVDRAKLLERTRLNIEKFGLQVIMVQRSDYNPSFAYSVGITQTYNHPEVICFGLSTDLGESKGGKWTRRKVEDDFIE